MHTNHTRPFILPHAHTRVGRPQINANRTIKGTRHCLRDLDFGFQLRRGDVDNHNSTWFAWGLES